MLDILATKIEGQFCGRYSGSKNLTANEIHSMGMKKHTCQVNSSLSSHVTESDYIIHYL